MLFTLYGPASRLLMAGCLSVGLLSYSRQDKPDSQAKSQHYWWAWLGVFMLINLLVYFLSSASWARVAQWVMEILSIAIWLVGVITILMRSNRPPMMIVYGVAIIFFAQSSFAFLLSTAWSHMWWLAHIIFASGFMLLSYAVLRVFLTTGSFSQVYSQAELFEQIKKEKSRAETALLELQTVYEQLEQVAATDTLTGCANRREFEKRCACCRTLTAAG